MNLSERELRDLPRGAARTEAHRTVSGFAIVETAWPHRPRQPWETCAHCRFACDTNMAGEKLPKLPDGQVLVCRRDTPYYWADVTDTCWCGQGAFDRPETS